MPQKEGKKLVMNLGYSHQVIVPEIEGITIDVPDAKHRSSSSGIDKQKVGQFAAEVREKRPPEPYKGKGIKYDYESHPPQRRQDRCVSKKGGVPEWLRDLIPEAQRSKRHNRVRSKISGTAERPRLCVFRSESNIYAQIIDDVAGNTLVSASTVEKAFEGNGGNCEAAKKIGAAIAERAHAEGHRRSRVRPRRLHLSRPRARHWPRAPARAA